MIPLIIFSLASCTLAQAQNFDDEDLDLAEPLEDKLLTESITEDGSGAKVKYRGYLEGFYQSVTFANDQQTFISNFEGALAVSTSPKSKISSFLDISGSYQRQLNNSKNFAILNQLGVRFRPSEHVALAIGKERNRRAPGLLFSPSDLLHTQQSAPGLRVDRSGIWLARMSYQTETGTADLILLPAESERENGLFDELSNEASGLARFFIRYSGLEVSVSGGKIDGIDRYGLYLQGFVNKIIKLYAEWGFAAEETVFLWNRESVNSWLLGTSYQGDGDFILTLEYLHLPGLLSDDELTILSQQPNIQGLASPFITPRNMIASLSIVDIWDRMNLFVTATHNLNYSQTNILTKLDVILSNSFTLGFSYGSFDKGNSGMSLPRPFNEFYDIGIRWSF